MIYQPLDIGWRKDRKVRLLGQEFGPAGIIILLGFWELCYSENGYFAVWDKDSALLLADDIGMGIKPTEVTEVLDGCLRRQLFEEAVLSKYGVLTSAGVQRRYLMAFRENILKSAAGNRHREVFAELWLLESSQMAEVFRSRWKEGLLKYIPYEGFSEKNTSKSGKNTGSINKADGKNKPSNTASVKDPDSIFALFASEHVPIGGGEKAAIRSWLASGFEEAVLKEALKRAVLHGVRDFPYIKKIIHNWFLAEALTLETIEKRGL